MRLFRVCGTYHLPGVGHFSAECEVFAENHDQALDLVMKNPLPHILQLKNIHVAGEICSGTPRIRMWDLTSLPSNAHEELRRKGITI